MNDNDGPEAQVSELMIAKMALYYRLSFLNVNLVGKIATLYHYKHRQGKVARAVRTHMLWPLIACRNKVTNITEQLQDSRYVGFHTDKGAVIKPFIKMIEDEVKSVEERFAEIQMIGNKKMRGE
jgi:hypothetical protein